MKTKDSLLIGLCSSFLALIDVKMNVIMRHVGITKDDYPEEYERIRKMSENIKDQIDIITSLSGLGID